MFTQEWTPVKVFSIVAQELFLEDLPVVDCASAAYGKRQSNEPFSCEQ